jgi:glycosyltransferase involved in cell wall biosynthesis
MAEATVVVSAYNEGERIGPLLRELSKTYSVRVVGDRSSDITVPMARAAGATVI